MIFFVEGTLEEKQPTRVVINAAGVGYEVFIPLSSYDRLPAEGDRVRVFTYDAVREDDHLLYGFMSREERRLFVMLLTVSGIGPKIALSALSGLTTRELKAALVGADIKRLSMVPGIGRKTAERMVVELKDRLGAAEALQARSAEGEAAPGDLRMRDAVLALISLGYKRAEAENLIRKVIEGAPAEATVEDLIRKALAG